MFGGEVRKVEGQPKKWTWREAFVAAAVDICFSKVASRKRAGLCGFGPWVCLELLASAKAV